MASLTLDVNLSKLQETVKVGEPGVLQSVGLQTHRWTRLINNNKKPLSFECKILFIPSEQRSLNNVAPKEKGKQCLLLGGSLLGIAGHTRELWFHI